MNNNDLVNKMTEYMSKYSDASFSHWINYELFTWQWWLCVFLCTVPLFIWWKVVEKKRLFEIMIFGLLVNITCSYLDVIGTSFALWQYKIKIVPCVPLFFPIDYTVIPVTYMILYQMFSKWKSFIIAVIITSLVFSFIGEPLDVWAGMYVMKRWNYIYSLPIYILIAIVCKATVIWFIKKNRG
ncbi:MAG: CBO0543 family protein [Bacillota bacterium]|nr:CBO0543 family protein [Bacillota bacterium]